MRGRLWTWLREGPAKAGRHVRARRNSARLLTTSVWTPNISLDALEGYGMKRHLLLSSVAAGLAAWMISPQTPGLRLHAQSVGSVALRGHVSSTGQPSMEGVIVTAKKTGAAVSTSVVTNAAGDFEFPAGRVNAGAYSIRIRA